MPSGSLFFVVCKIIADSGAVGTVRASRSVILRAQHFFFIASSVMLLDLPRVIGSVRSVDGRRRRVAS